MMFGGVIFYCITLLGVVFSVLPMFFGMHYLRGASSYGAVAVIALAVYASQALLTVLLTLLLSGAFMGSSFGFGINMLWAFASPILVFGIICSYLTTFGILASAYFVFGHADGEAQ
jgi:hypothetical protein